MRLAVMWSAFVVMVKSHGAIVDDAKVGNKQPKPNEFISCKSHGTIFGFRIWAIDNSSLLVLPIVGNIPKSKGYTIASDRSKSTWTSTLIKITIGCKMGGRETQ